MDIGRRIMGIRPRGEFGRGVTTLVAGTGAAQVLVIATSPVITRLYSPSDFGVYAVATSILSVLVTVTCLRYDFAIPLSKDDLVAANVLGLSLVISGLLSLIGGIILWLVAPWFLPIFGASALIPYVWVISIGQFGAGIVSSLTNWAVRTKTFADIAATRVTQGVVLAGTQIALGLAGAGAVGLVVGDAAGRVAGSTRLGRVAWRSHADVFRHVSWAGMRENAVRYRRFPIYSMPSALLATFAATLPVLLLIAYYGTVAGGYLALAVRICAIPLTLIANAVGQVFVAESSRLIHTSPEALPGLFSRTSWTLAKVGILPSILGMILAPLLSGFVFGSDWAEVGVYVAILIPSYFVQFVIAATGDVIYVVERQDLQLGREVVRFALLGLSVPVASAIGLSAIGAVALLSITGIITYLFYGLVTWRAIHAPAIAGQMT